MRSFKQSQKSRSDHLEELQNVAQDVRNDKGRLKFVQDSGKLKVCCEGFLISEKTASPSISESCSITF